MKDDAKYLENKYLNVKSAAYYLGVTPRALRDFELRGVIQCCRLGRSVRFNIAELDTYLFQNRIPTLVEIKDGGPQIPPGPIGPLISPDAAAEYLGLPSARSVMQRVNRMQLPAYKISDRVFRFRKCELDNCMLTNHINAANVEDSACLPELGRR